MHTESSTSAVLVIRGGVLPLADRVHIMGILNVTPDSFSDGGRHLNPDDAVAQALSMVEQGADVLDIGAESSRPGAVPIDEEEERRRLIPIVRAICRRVSIPVSIDTTKASIAERALDEGAAIINDISALRFDARMGAVVAKSSAGLILMHMQGHPQTMQHAAQYADVVGEVRRRCAERDRLDRLADRCSEVVEGDVAGPDHRCPLPAFLDRRHLALADDSLAAPAWLWAGVHPGHHGGRPRTGRKPGLAVGRD